MSLQGMPRTGTKDRIKYDLLTRPKGATLDEINRAGGHDAWSYVNDTKRLARRCGGTPHWNGGGGSRRFWNEMQKSRSDEATRLRSK